MCEKRTAGGSIPSGRKPSAGMVCVSREVGDCSDPCLASLAEALEFLATSALTGLFVVGLAPHFLAKTAALAEFAEASHRFLDRLAGTNPKLHHKQPPSAEIGVPNTTRQKASRPGRVYDPRAARPENRNVTYFDRPAKSRSDRLFEKRGIASRGPVPVRGRMGGAVNTHLRLRRRSPRGCRRSLHPRPRPHRTRRGLRLLRRRGCVPRAGGLR